MSNIQSNMSFLSVYKSNLPQDWREELAQTLLETTNSYQNLKLHHIRMLKTCALLSNEAALRLGILYFRGIGVSQNFQLAYHLFKRVERDQTCWYALWFLGLMYEGGTCVQRSVDRAVDYYTRCAQRGSNPARKRIAFLANQGHLKAIEKNFEIGFKYNGSSSSS